MSRPAPQPELDAEREVDLGRAAGAIAQRWWLPLVGLVVGLVIGWAMAVGSTQVYRASALMYTGFPLAVGGGPLPGVNSAPATVRQLIQSDEVVQRVATVSGLRPGQVRSGTSLSTPSGGRGVQAQTLTITVRGPARRRVRLAANELARIVSNRLGRFVDGKISNYERQVSSQQAALDALSRSIDETTRAAARPPARPDAAPRPPLDAEHVRGAPRRARVGGALHAPAARPGAGVREAGDPGARSPAGGHRAEQAQLARRGRRARPAGRDHRGARLGSRRGPDPPDVRRG